MEDRRDEDQVSSRYVLKRSASKPQDAAGRSKTPQTVAKRRQTPQT